MDDIYGVLGTVAVLIIVSLTACDRKRSQAVFVGNAQEQQPADPEPTPPEPKKEAKPLKIPPVPDELHRLGIGATVRVVNSEIDASGVILGKDTEDHLYVLTVWHAAKHEIERIELFSITSLDQKPHAILNNPALHSNSPERDLAILAVKIDPNLTFDSVCLESAPKTGQNPFFAYSAGCSGGRYPTVLGERITGHDRFHPKGGTVNAVMWTADKPQEEGRSGGPLLDAKGRLIGIALGKEGLTGYYCHSSEIADYLIDKGPKRLVRCPKLDKY